MTVPFTCSLRIRGLVQGVGYRWSMTNEAIRLGLDGWVRNRRDGSVEALVCGPKPQVDALIAWAKLGPGGARVSSVDVTPSSQTVTRGFTQRPTE